MDCKPNSAQCFEEEQKEMLGQCSGILKFSRFSWPSNSAPALRLTRRWSLHAGSCVVSPLGMYLAHTCDYLITSSCKCRLL